MFWYKIIDESPSPAGRLQPWPSVAVIYMKSYQLKDDNQKPLCVFKKLPSLAVIVIIVNLSCFDIK